MFFHGGGWVLGDFPTHERLIRDLARASGAAAVYVDYSPSPEARYPVAIHQAYAATKWVAAHGAEIGVDGTRLALVGNSVGGNMAASVALQAKAAGTPAIRYEVLLWPVTDAAFDNGSYQQFQQGYFLSRNMMRWFWDSYTTDPAQRREIYASPLQASVEQLKGLPPTLIQTAELDVLRERRSLRPQARPGRRGGHRDPLQRPDPRLRLAQRTQRCAGRPYRDPSGRRRVAAAPGQVRAANKT